MKYANSFLRAILIVMIAGCGTMQTADESSFPMTANGMMQPQVFPRVPVWNYAGSVGPLAPFLNVVNEVTVKNKVAYYGDKPLIITAIWINGQKMPLRKIKMMNGVLPLLYLEYLETFIAGTPSPHLLDGTGEGKVRVVAQAASWYIDIMGRKVPADNAGCFETTVVVGAETAVLTWANKTGNAPTCRV